MSRGKKEKKRKEKKRKEKKRKEKKRKEKETGQCSPLYASCSLASSMQTKEIVRGSINHV